MNLLVFLVVAFSILAVGLKVYSIYRRSQEQTQMTSEGDPTDLEASDIQCVNSDTTAGENIADSTSDWGEIFLVIAGMLLCAPFGLILLWKTDNLDTKTKKLIIIGYAAIVIMAVALKLGFS